MSGATTRVQEPDFPQYAFKPEGLSEGARELLLRVWREEDVELAVKVLVANPSKMSRVAGELQRSAQFYGMARSHARLLTEALVFLAAERLEKTPPGRDMLPAKAHVSLTSETARGAG